MLIKVAGENSLIVYFETGDRLHNNECVISLALTLTSEQPKWLIDITPAFSSLLLTFDLYQIDFLAVKQFLFKLNLPLKKRKTCIQHAIQIPVLYDYPQSNDLARIADATGLSKEDIIELHQSRQYRVYAIGFAPGFAFLGDLDERISMPRLSTPRTQVPAGAVGIADQQTAVYPNKSPGGWNIIGLSPFIFFDSTRLEPVSLKVGDDVVFKAVTKNEFFTLGGTL